MTRSLSAFSFYQLPDLYFYTLLKWFFNMKSTLLSELYYGMILLGDQKTGYDFSRLENEMHISKASGHAWERGESKWARVSCFPN